MTIVKVAIDTSVYTLDREYDYAVPPHLERAALPGARVVVPFGRANRLTQGLILAPSSDSGQPLKQLETVLDDPPLLDADLLELARLLKERCFCTLFDALRAMLPVGVRFSLEQVLAVDPAAPTEGLGEPELAVLEAVRRQKQPTVNSIGKLLGADAAVPVTGLLREGVLIPRLERAGLAGETLRQVARLTKGHEELEDFLARSGRNRPRRERVVELLEQGDLPVAEVCYLAGVSRTVLATLERHGVLEIVEREQLHLPYRHKREGRGDTAPLQLSQEQQAVVDRLSALLRQEDAAVALLHGVTGSGKTLCYLALIDQVAAQGGGVLVLVPEIVLTPQLTDRFYSRYGDRVAVLHSGLSAGERRDEWRRIRRGDCSIVVGTRSAVFAPVRDLALIVMDEEQEYAYKSEQTPRYHARTIAKVRAAQRGALLLLCSATPSVESYAAAKQGRYHLLELRHRYQGAALPHVTVTHLREELSQGLSAVTGPTLIEALGSTLEAGKQAILFLNRRGYHTFLSCRICGNVIQCQNCAISMTYHSANNLLQCHYCGSAQEVPQLCPECGQLALSRHGFGTQRVEEEIRRLFPESSILRMDADTTATRMSHDEMLQRFEAGEYNILLGTQIVTKGLDFPGVSLVGVLFADSLLFSDDFRAGERAFSLLTQVTGRAGRADTPGRAIIETFAPENRIIELARRQDYPAFFASELAFRKAAAYPPYCDIYAVLFSSEQEEKSGAAAAYFSQQLRKVFQNMQNHSIILFPVTPAPVQRLKGRHRHRLLLKCYDSAELRDALRQALLALHGNREFAQVTCTIDLNPYNMT